MCSPQLEIALTTECSRIRLGHPAREVSAATLPCHCYVFQGGLYGTAHESKIFKRETYEGMKETQPSTDQMIHKLSVH